CGIVALEHGAIAPGGRVAGRFRGKLSTHGLEIAGALETAEVLAGGVESVGVVDSEPGDGALADERKGEAACLRGSTWVLCPDGRQLVDIEEASIVDFLS